MRGAWGRGERPFCQFLVIGGGGGVGAVGGGDGCGGWWKGEEHS